ncbi:MAG TPA: PEP-CTERM sorting domain-containing protein [Thermoguttaceae bacterium]|nr:PEP-CTERM sorting domain-containing protein [Thermoguttaceae bacterium]
MRIEASRGPLWVGVIVCLSFIGSAAPARGDVVSYTTAASAVVFNFDDDLVESPSPWFGTQIASDNGLTLIPYDFRASSLGGSPLIDALDGTFVVTISAKPGQSIHSVIISEKGDFDLFSAGGGTAMTQVDVKAVFDPYVKVNGSWLTLPSVHMAFSQNSGGPFNQNGNYNVVANPGTGQDWYGRVFLNVAAAASGPVEQVMLVLDNKLLAISEASTYAFIAKKRLEFEAVVPEPSGLALLAAGAFAWLAWRRK